jgi:hypothetical protein
MSGLLRQAIFVAALFCFVAPAGADPRWVTPPARYVHPFAGRVLVLQNWTPFALGAFWPVYGYSFVWHSNPPICVMQVWRQAYNASLYRHERAHCNGWPAWHPLS